MPSENDVKLKLNVKKNAQTKNPRNTAKRVAKRCTIILCNAHLTTSITIIRIKEEDATRTPVDHRQKAPVGKRNGERLAPRVGDVDPK